MIAAETCVEFDLSMQIIVTSAPDEPHGRIAMLSNLCEIALYHQPQNSRYCVTQYRLLSITLLCHFSSTNKLEQYLQLVVRSEPARQ